MTIETFTSKNASLRFDFSNKQYYNNINSDDSNI